MPDQEVVSVPEDPTSTDPSLYKVVFENDRVRRRLHGEDGRQADVDLPAGQARWVGAQTHAGENIGASESHSIFVELKEPPPAGAPAGDPPLGPAT
jgi:beta-alanine degradation protein BauB